MHHTLTAAASFRNRRIASRRARPAAADPSKNIRVVVPLQPAVRATSWPAYSAAKMGLVAKHSTPEEFGKFVQAEMSRWRTVLTKKP